MINSYLSLKKQHGGATLIISVVLMITATLIIIFAADQNRVQKTLAANQIKNGQAFQAAEAGIEFGINYLRQNSATILANKSGGYVQSYSDSNTTNVALANGSRYSIVYSNPVANNYDLILITSTGRSAGNNATRIIGQLVQRGSMLATPPVSSLVTKGTLSMSGNSGLVNTVNNQTVSSASTVSLNGSAQTTTSSGTSSTAGNIKSDITQNVASLQSLSLNDFFASYFGVPSNTLKSEAAHYYSNSSNTNYSSMLNGMTGTSIWIDQASGTATLNGTTTIGSPTAPVLLVINGNVELKGNLSIYGFVYVIGDTTTEILGNVAIVGSMVTTGNLTMTGSTVVTYDPDVLSSLQTQSSTSYYAKVPGSWKDF